MSEVGGVSGVMMSSAEENTCSGRKAASVWTTAARGGHWPRGLPVSRWPDWLSCVVPRLDGQSESRCGPLHPLQVCCQGQGVCLQAYPEFQLLQG